MHGGCWSCWSCRRVMGYGVERAQVRGMGCEGGERGGWNGDGTDGVLYKPGSMLHGSWAVRCSIDWRPCRCCPC